jgi:hypothetical protein
MLLLKSKRKRTQQIETHLTFGALPSDIKILIFQHAHEIGTYTNVGRCALTCRELNDIIRVESERRHRSFMNGTPLGRKEELRKRNWMCIPTSEHLHELLIHPKFPHVKDVIFQVSMYDASKYTHYVDYDDPPEFMNRYWLGPPPKLEFHEILKLDKMERTCTNMLELTCDDNPEQRMSIHMDGEIHIHTDKGFHYWTPIEFSDEHNTIVPVPTWSVQIFVKKRRRV